MFTVIFLTFNRCSFQIFILPIETSSSLSKNSTPESSKDSLLNIDWSKADLTENQQKKFSILLKNYTDVFAQNDFDLSKTNVTEFEILLSSHALIACQSCNVLWYKNILIKC